MWDKVYIYTAPCVGIFNLCCLKDDKVSMDFVAAAANLRAHVFNISRKSRFDIKC